MHTMLQWKQAAPRRSPAASDSLQRPQQQQPGRGKHQVCGSRGASLHTPAAGNRRGQHVGAVRARRFQERKVRFPTSPVLMPCCMTRGTLLLASITVELVAPRTYFMFACLAMCSLISKQVFELKLTQGRCGCHLACNTSSSCCCTRDRDMQCMGSRAVRGLLCADGCSPSMLSKARTICSAYYECPTTKAGHDSSFLCQ
jgi:hypothetical protein